MNRTNRPFKYERRFSQQLDRQYAWIKLLKKLAAAGTPLTAWNQGDSITMGDGRMYIVQRTGEWHKVVEEQR